MNKARKTSKWAALSVGVALMGLLLAAPASAGVVIEWLGSHYPFDLSSAIFLIIGLCWVSSSVLACLSALELQP